MKKYPILILLISILGLSSCKLKYQPYQQNDVWEEGDSINALFSNFQALQTSTVSISMEGEMIRINLAIVDETPSSKTFRKIRRRLAPNAGLVVENDSTLPRPNRMWMEKVIIHDSLFQYIMYFAYSLDTATQFAKAVFYREEQISRVHEILKSIAKDGIPLEIFEDISAVNVNFIGRDLSLASYCEWESAHRLECPGKGRISWSIHPDFQSALKSRDIQIDYSRNYQYSILEDEKEVEVIFEGKPLKAHRMEFTLKNGRIINLKRDRLIAYYLAGEVRGRYIHAVLSYHQNEAPIGGLPSLLEKVMSLPE